MAFKKPNLGYRQKLTCPITLRKSLMSVPHTLVALSEVSKSKGKCYRLKFPFTESATQAQHSCSVRSQNSLLQAEIATSSVGRGKKKDFLLSDSIF